MTIENIGHTFTLAGINVQLKRESYNAIYPYPHRVVRIIAHPTVAGQRTNLYRSYRDTLGDDWVTDMTQSDNLIDALELAGLDDDNIEEIIVNRSF